jgi:uncharacterized protein YraI
MMRRQFIRWICAGLLGLSALPGVALAQQVQAFTSGPVNLRAGPARDYPVVSQVAPGVPVTVMGCISGYTWCDVALPNLRGWVYAKHLSYPYQGNNVPVITYGTTIGVPIVSFSIGAYWGNYYRGRPWYRDQNRWARRTPPRPHPAHPPGRPRPPGGGHPPGHARPPGGHPPGAGGRPPGRPPQGGGGRPPGRPGGGGGHNGGGNHGGGQGGGGRPSGGGGGGHGGPPRR